jgi:hypothetical protein
MEEGDWEQAWALTDEVFRLAQVQAWLWPHRLHPELAGEDLDALAAAMSSDQAVLHPLWDEFAEAVLRTFHETWREFDLSRWSEAGPPIVVAPDLEVVVFAREEERVIEVEEAIYVARPFLMRFTPKHWLVAHAGSNQLPVPGWPPEFPPVSWPA